MRAVEKTDVARTPRIVIPDLAHHVTQRGVRRQDVKNKAINKAISSIFKLVRLKGIVPFVRNILEK